MGAAHVRDRERDNVADRDVAKVSVEEYGEYGNETEVVESVEVVSKARTVGCKVAELARFVTRAGNIVELSPYLICWGSCQTIILK